MDRMKKLSDTIRMLMEEEFSGYIRINFSQGSLGRVEKAEEFEEAAIVLAGRNNGIKREKQMRDKEFSHTVNQALLQDTAQNKIQAIIPLFLMLSMAGCATHGADRIVLSGEAAGSAMKRMVQPGDTAEVQYACSLTTGELASATGVVSEKRPKANIFEARKEAGPVSITAINPAGTQPKKIPPPPFELEIQDQLSRIVTGMKEGEKREVTLTAQAATPPDSSGIARIARTRIRPKEMTMPKGDYEFRAKQAPETGQVFVFDPAFPGKVVSMTDKDVVIQFSAQPGEIIQTPFGPGRVREEGNAYKVEIEAREGGLIRTGNRIGKISVPSERVIAVDYRHPFGYETLSCEVTIEKIVELKSAESGTGK